MASYWVAKCRPINIKSRCPRVAATLLGRWGHIRRPVVVISLVLLMTASSCADSSTQRTATLSTGSSPQSSGRSTHDSEVRVRAYSNGSNSSMIAAEHDGQCGPDSGSLQPTLVAAFTPTAPVVVSDSSGAVIATTRVGFGRVVNAGATGEFDCMWTWRFVALPESTAYFISVAGRRAVTLSLESMKLANWSIEVSLT